MLAKSYSSLLKKYHISYLGSHGQSMKMKLSEDAGTITYSIYLAPSNLSGRNVCPMSTYCREHCLNGSGHNKADELKRGKNSLINQSRIKKTRMFFENRNDFMEILVHEIDKAQQYADNHNMPFSIRLNCTSDLPPEMFKKDGKNILELYPNIQFYDYTKVPSRLSLQNKYDNYDLPSSFDGHNWDVCKDYLDKGGKVAVVFFWEMPKNWRGYNVFDANIDDIRYKAPNGEIMGLHYHKTANDFINGKFQVPKTDFVVLC